MFLPLPLALLLVLVMRLRLVPPRTRVALRPMGVVRAVILALVLPLRMRRSARGMRSAERTRVVPLAPRAAQRDPHA